MNDIYFIIIIIGIALLLVSHVLVVISVFHVKKQKENEYYTDYVHNRLILRIYKPEFEYVAVGKVSIDRILDRGTFSMYYNWVLIEG